MSKKLRTPIIKPRTQGGTFYTFGSAMEDIGLNINESFNRVELSHYVLLNIPKFCSSVGDIPSEHKDNTYIVLDTKLKYDDESSYSNQGDYMFAESFQDYCLNMETVVRNCDGYNYAANKTVSERVFWKWLFGKVYNYDSSSFGRAFTKENGYFYETDTKNAIVKGFGSISAGAQRTDDSGIYNETFVQIPSSFGQMRVLFKPSIDENYQYTKYHGTNDTSTKILIENINADEISGDGDTRIINSTGISPIASVDGVEPNDGSIYYEVSDNRTFDNLEVVLDIEKIRQYYESKGILNTQTLTYDDIATGKVDDIINNDYSFNAVLVYYSIYNSDKTKRLATNAYGIYILDTSLREDDSINENSESDVFYFSSLEKRKTTAEKNGSSYSFRINIKPTSAYSGDIHVNDNSTEGFAMSEDFNDVIRNLTAAIKVLGSNTKTLAKISQDNKEIKQMATDSMEKVDDIENDVTVLKNVNFPYTSDNIVENGQILSADSAKNILNCLNIVYGSDGKISMTIDPSSLSNETEKMIARHMIRTIDGYNYVDALSTLMLLCAARK